jgi:hypothetical protein
VGGGSRPLGQGRRVVVWWDSVVGRGGVWAHVWFSSFLFLISILFSLFQIFSFRILIQILFRVQISILYASHETPAC